MNVRQDSMIDTVFDSRYRIQRRIGVGGMARVYLAEDETLGRSVAIKVLNARYAEDDQFVERFLREASAAARLNHPNIVQVYDRGEADDTYYIAMEYVDGSTLKDIITSRGPLASQQTIEFTRQALNALRFAHRNGIVHRDVKPHNMMVDGEGRLKIADFGIARAGSDQGLTEVGSIVGTAQYLSPEQAQGEIVSAASDLYSLGVVMFEMATGTVPYDGDSPVNIALKQVNDPIPVPHHRNPDVSGALEAIIIRAMQKDPEIRYQTADEFMHDLDKAERGIVPAETAAITQVVARQQAAATTVTPQVARTSMQPPPPRPTTDRARREEPKRKKWPWVLLMFLIAAVAAVAVWALTSSGNNEIKVPNVIGMTQQKAEETLNDAGFTVDGDVTTEASDDVKVGIVLSEDPSAGDKAEPGKDTIHLTVSAGPEAVEVPNVVGTTEDEARRALEDAGFEVTVANVPSEAVDEGSVVAQDPGAGEEKVPGTRIRINVSTGSAKVVVPDVTGMSVATARTKLQDAGFTVSTTKQDGTDPQNEVLDQAPVANSKAAKGSKVVITIGSGYNVVPDVSGQTKVSAQTELEEAGYNVTFTEIPDPAASADGEVTAQNPPAGDRYKIGYTVTVTVNIAP